MMTGRSVLLLLVSLPVTLAAQVPDSVVAPLVPKSSMVRMRMRGTEMTGKLIALTSGVATISTESGNQTATLASVDSIWVRGSAVKKGALIGGVAGAVLFGTFVAVVVDAVCEVDCDNEWVGGAFVGGGLGFLGGGLLGAGIGALIPKWRLRFP